MGSVPAVRQPPHVVPERVLIVAGPNEIINPALVAAQLAEVGLKPTRNVGRTTIQRLDRLQEAVRLLGIDPFRVIDSCLAWSDGDRHRVGGPWQVLAVEATAIVSAALAA